MNALSTTRPTQPQGWRAWLGQIVLYGLFAAAIGTFAQWPPYRHLEPKQALIKLSFTRVGKPVGDCRPLTAAEAAKLQPNMRPTSVCPRERSPLVVQVALNGKPLVDRLVPPTGLARDGAASIYERIVVPAGEQRVAVRLSDDVRARDRPFQREATVTLAPGQVLVIDFDAGKGEIVLQ
jgi:hypothetical protein